MPHTRFISVEAPSKADGVGRALQIAFRDGFELPDELRARVEQLDKIRI